MCFLGCITGLLLGGASLVAAQAPPLLISPATAERAHNGEPFVGIRSPELGAATGAIPILVDPPLKVSEIVPPLVQPPCCQTRKERAPPETVDVISPRLKSMEAFAEESIPAEMKRTVAVASERLFEAIELDDDAHTSPCCVPERRRKDPVQVEPPRLKSMEVAGEEKIPAERKLTVAVASQRLPKANEQKLEIHEPECCETERREGPIEVESPRWTWGKTWPAVALGFAIIVLTVAGFLLAFRGHKSRYEADLQPRRSALLKGTPPLDETPIQSPLVVAAPKRSLLRALEDA